MGEGFELVEGEGPARELRKKVEEEVKVKRRLGKEKIRKMIRLQETKRVLKSFECRDRLKVTSLFSKTQKDTSLRDSFFEP